MVIRLRESRTRLSAITTIVSSAPSTPPREKVKMAWAKNQSASPLHSSRSHQAAPLSMTTQKQQTTPRPRVAETWFGPKPPLVWKLDSVVKLSRSAVRIPTSAIAATMIVGMAKASISRRTPARSSWIWENSQAHASTASGPERVKLIRSRAISS